MINLTILFRVLSTLTSAFSSASLCLATWSFLLICLVKRFHMTSYSDSISPTFLFIVTHEMFVFIVFWDWQKKNGARVSHALVWQDFWIVAIVAMFAFFPTIVKIWKHGIVLKNVRRQALNVMFSKLSRIYDLWQLPLYQPSLTTDETKEARKLLSSAFDELKHCLWLISFLSKQELFLFVSRT